MPSQGVLLSDWLQSWRGRAADIRDFWTGVALVCWCLWRHQNEVVFEGTTPSSSTVIRNIRSEAVLWKAAGLFRAELSLGDRWRLGE
jgi:hypothetical protein